MTVRKRGNWVIGNSVKSLSHFSVPFTEPNRLCFKCSFKHSLFLSLAHLASLPANFRFVAGWTATGMTDVTWARTRPPQRGSGQCRAAWRTGTPPPGARPPPPSRPSGLRARWNSSLAAGGHSVLWPPLSQTAGYRSKLSARPTVNDRCFIFRRG